MSRCRRACFPAPTKSSNSRPVFLKRVAIFQIRLPRFRSLFPHVFGAKPLHTFARHAVTPSSYSAALVCTGAVVCIKRLRFATGGTDTKRG
ncbi:hypothetical protein E0J21_07165 [Rhizobium laguerreae]|nr:hypothetical protein E0J21_07165 [Rhizobium laguerreae]